MKAIKFKNFSEEDFTYSFDSIPYTFPAGTEMFLEDYKAEHFAKHLVDRELNRLRIPTNHPIKRPELLKLCFPSDEVVTPIEALNIEETKVRRGRSKTKKVVEKEFEELG